MNTLVEKILDPLREKVGAIKVTSGYRSPEYNKQIGGSPTSQHCKGEAVDMQPLNKSIQEVFEIIKKEFNFDQVILEKNNSGAEWIQDTTFKPFKCVSASVEMSRLFHCHT